MFLQLMFPLKRTWAQVARERCLSSVSPHVDFQVALLDERKLAHAALERFLSRVRPHVPNKAAATPRCVWAEVAPVSIFLLTLLSRAGLLISQSVMVWCSVVSPVHPNAGKRVVCALKSSPPDCCI